MTRFGYTPGWQKRAIDIANMFDRKIDSQFDWHHSKKRIDQHTAMLDRDYQDQPCWQNLGDDMKTAALLAVDAARNKTETNALFKQLHIYKSSPDIKNQDIAIRRFAADAATLVGQKAVSDDHRIDNASRVWNIALGLDATNEAGRRWCHDNQVLFHRPEKPHCACNDNLPQQQNHIDAERLRRLGRHGDSVLAHITPAEAALLDQVTDGGSINPHTGLPEFFDLSASKENDLSGDTNETNKPEMSAIPDEYPKVELLPPSLEQDAFTPNHLPNLLQIEKSVENDPYSNARPGFGCAGKWAPGPIELTGGNSGTYFFMKKAELHVNSRAGIGLDQIVYKAWTRKLDNNCKIADGYYAPKPSNWSSTGEYGTNQSKVKTFHAPKGAKNGCVLFVEVKRTSPNNDSSTGASLNVIVE